MATKIYDKATAQRMLDEAIFESQQASEEARRLENEQSAAYRREKKALDQRRLAVLRYFAAQTGEPFDDEIVVTIPTCG